MSSSVFTSVRNFFAIGAVCAATSMTFVVPAVSGETGLASALHSLRVERGRVCMVGHYHTGLSGIHAKKGAAFSEAVRKWQSFTNMEYGSSWASLKMAAEKRKLCTDRGVGYVCRVKARPCKRR